MMKRMTKPKIPIEGVMTHAGMLAQQHSIRVNPELFSQFIAYRTAYAARKKRTDVTSDTVYSWVCDYNRFANLWQGNKLRKGLSE